MTTSVKEKAAFSQPTTTLTTSSPPQNRSSPAKAALMTSETSSRNPSARMIPADNTRVRMKYQKPWRFSEGTSQIWSSPVFSSASAVFAPMSSVTTLTIVAMVPAPGRFAFSNTACTALAPVVPIRPRICATISPRAAFSPKKNPAIAIDRMRTGASEKTV